MWQYDVHDQHLVFVLRCEIQAFKSVAGAIHHKTMCPQTLPKNVGNFWIIFNHKYSHASILTQIPLQNLIYSHDLTFDRWFPSSHRGLHRRFVMAHTVACPACLIFCPSLPAKFSWK